ncbi:hypothetical protein K6119_16165 [Paracrocinitomix mangrovi]|uniref:hypothetical protein n=1 Tax=Paracrocinitomix mangrovi TaxID=2862509 RepID=UPI001C8E1EC5|nr:hypothetical protein [Paracrocinitomix mangrovi]UKN01264.1 hypothetical protein K6119_16165 [Paracrocinitomix mangrovi]
MKKTSLIIVVLVIVALGIWAILLMDNGGGSQLSDEALSDFAIEDTASIDKIILTDTEGNKGVTLLREGVSWTNVNNECIQQHLVQTILVTFKHIMVKSPVPKGTVDQVNKNLTTHHKKVEIYQNGKLLKTWYVGQPTQDQYGTYMLLKDPEKGKSPEPFIMYLPNMHGNLETRFITNPLEFECTEVFAYDPANIKSVSVELPDSAQFNFKIDALDNNLFKMSSNGNSIDGFDTVAVRNYLVGFRKIHFEQHNYLINKHSEDSLKQTTPWYNIEVTDKAGETNKVVCYRKKMTYERYDFDGNLIDYDRDRLWVVLNDGRLVVGQFYVFDKILRDLRFFTQGQTPS